MSFPFPMFPDGDVHITVGEEEFQLHSGLLMDRSPMLKRLIVPFVFARANPEDLIHLAVIVEGSEDEVGHLEVVSQAATAHGSGSEGHAPENDAPEEQDDGDEEDSEDEGLSQAICEAWGDAFKCLYDLHVDVRALDDDEILDHCWAILNITAHLSIKTEIVTWCISCGLSQRQGDLTRIISEDPVSWAILARHMRLAWVYVESVGHLVEQWEAIPAERLQDVTVDTLDLCKTLRDSLLQGTYSGVEEDDCPWYAFPDSSEGSVPTLADEEDLMPLLPEFIALVNHWAVVDRAGQEPHSDLVTAVGPLVEDFSQGPQTDTTLARDQLLLRDVEATLAEFLAW